jgi:hypothetical protein
MIYEEEREVDREMDFRWEIKMDIGLGRKEKEGRLSS